MKTHKFSISSKWYKNDNGGDVRTLCIDYSDLTDKKNQIDTILKDFRTKPMDVGEHKNKIPYSVSTTIPTFKKW